MPTAHRRVALVVDEPVAQALTALRHDPSTPDARLARRAVLDGAIVDLLCDAAASSGPTQADAAELLQRLVELVRGLGIPPALVEGLEGRLAEARERGSVEHRRALQLALLRTTEAPAGEPSAQDLADSFDAFGLE